ncbi:Putative esterase [Pirellulimonas nuda]|uniref:Esterase n=1 Tax=Pirellulimonas nuda TaxID=2528009 RepID=A0A518D769_9BACT|nr:alpha/beta hydrolase-fold protein [Pirellulimonas nuda]QDU87330.1 Putative esterase [Pirellulimonas nuda]
MPGWSEVELAGHGCSVFEPLEPSPHGYTLIYLHSVGLEDLRDCPGYAAQLQRRGLRMIAPRTGLSWWVDKVCDEFDPDVTAERYVADAVLPYIAERWGVRPPGIGLLGVSMGGQGALRLAYRKPSLFPVVAAVSPAVDFQNWMTYGAAAFSGEEQRGREASLWQMYGDPERARQDTATLHVHPLNWPRNQMFVCDPDDPWHESCDRLHMKLGSLGVPHEHDLETRAGGHSWDYFDAMAPRVFDFLVERLDAERRRQPTP